MPLITEIKMMVGTDHGGVRDVDDLDLGDDFFANYFSE